MLSRSEQDDEMNCVKSHREVVARTLELVPQEKQPNAEELVKYRIERYGNLEKIPEWKGYRLGVGFETETAEYAYNKFEPRSGDVLVATYSKTGTTWATEIVRNLFYIQNEDLLLKAKKIHHFYSYLSMGPVQKYQVLENLPLPRRFLGTHLPAPLINLEKFRKIGVKVLYVIRNPKDQAVSWYYHARAIPALKNEPWTEAFPQQEKLFYDAYIAGKQYFFAKEGEGYLEHVKEWYEHRNDSNVMFVVYEEMKKDRLRQIRRIADFIGVQLSEEELRKVCEDTSFDSMKSRAIVRDREKDVTGSTMWFRKGQVGDWKNHLTVAQSEMIDANVERILGDTDIKFIYELED